MKDPIEAEQIATCKQFDAVYTPTPLDSVMGFAVETQDLVPINGADCVPVDAHFAVEPGPSS